MSDHGLTEEQLEDLWTEIDNDSARGMDNADYPGDGVDSPVAYRSAHSRRSRHMANEYDDMNYDRESKRWN